MAAIHIRNNRSEQRLAPYSTNHIKDIPKLREFLTGIKPRLLLRNIPKDLTQVIICSGKSIIPFEFPFENFNFAIFESALD